MTNQEALDLINYTGYDCYYKDTREEILYTLQRAVNDLEAYKNDLEVYKRALENMCSNEETWIKIALEQAREDLENDRQKKRIKFEAGDDCEKWVYKCLNCKHSYTKRRNADEIYCSLKKECRYEEVKNGN